MVVLHRPYYIDAAGWLFGSDDRMQCSNDRRAERAKTQQEDEEAVPTILLDREEEGSTRSPHSAVVPTLIDVPKERVENQVAPMGGASRNESGTDSDGDGGSGDDQSYVSYGTSVADFESLSSSAELDEETTPTVPDKASVIRTDLDQMTVGQLRGTPERH